MYPLNVNLPEPLVGFARANDEAEHIALTAAGYVPAFVAAEKPAKGESPEKGATKGEKKA